MNADVAARNLIPTVTSATFDAYVLRAGEPVVVEFMSYGCAHCRAIDPALQHVARELAGHEAVVRVNVAVEQELADAYAVAATPTFVLFRDGREIERIEGPHPIYATLLAALSDPFAR